MTIVAATPIKRIRMISWSTTTLPNGTVVQGGMIIPDASVEERHDDDSVITEGAAAQFERWNKVLGPDGHYAVNQGLSARRAAEAQLFRSGDQHVILNSKTTIEVNGDGANDTARQVERSQGRSNGDLIRNLAGAVR